jgi:hypothetical protein
MIFAADHAVKYVGIAFFAVVAIFALRVAASSYLAERSDFIRWPAAEIS